MRDFNRFHHSLLFNRLDDPGNHQLVIGHEVTVRDMLDSLVGEAAKPGNVNIEAFDIGVRELHDLETGVATDMGMALQH